MCIYTENVCAAMQWIFILNSVACKYNHFFFIRVSPFSHTKYYYRISCRWDVANLPQSSLGMRVFWKGLFPYPKCICFKMLKFHLHPTLISYKKTEFLLYQHEVMCDQIQCHSITLSMWPTYTSKYLKNIICR